MCYILLSFSVCFGSRLARTLVSVRIYLLVTMAAVTAGGELQAETHKCASCGEEKPCVSAGKDDPIAQTYVQWRCSQCNSTKSRVTHQLRIDKVLAESYRKMTPDERKECMKKAGTGLIITGCKKQLWWCIF